MQTYDYLFKIEIKDLKDRKVLFKSLFVKNLMRTFSISVENYLDNFAVMQSLYEENKEKEKYSL